MDAWPYVVMVFIVCITIRDMVLSSNWDGSEELREELEGTIDDLEGKIVDINQDISALIKRVADLEGIKNKDV